MVDAAQPGLIARFGGHAMAAGLTLESERLPAFEAALRIAAEAMLDPALLQAELVSDGELQALQERALAARSVRARG